MLLGALGAILLRNMSPGKGAIGTGDGVIWAGCRKRGCRNESAVEQA